MTPESAPIPLSEPLQVDAHAPSPALGSAPSLLVISSAGAAADSGAGERERAEEEDAVREEGAPGYVHEEEGEITMLEETVVAGDEDGGGGGEEGHEEKGDEALGADIRRSPSLDSLEKVNGDQHLSDNVQEKDITASWDPLHRTGEAESKETPPIHDTTLVVEEGDVVDSNGRLLFPDSPAGSRRALNLRLDIKQPSPQPWDLIEPPTSNNDKQAYSPPSGASKFRTMQQSSNHTRVPIPKSSYYFGPPPADSAYGTPPIGHIGVHHPREILRVERDYTGGELIQFAPIYPLELEGRITPTQFLESINAINERLISAYSLRHAFVDNMLAVFSLQLSRLFVTTHFEKEMERVRYLIEDLNTGLYNPVGLNILWPRDVAFLYLEIEYY